MNPLRRLAALPLALMLFWAMVVAPAAYARCVHAGGDTHLHALGAACADDDSDHGTRADKKRNDGAPSGKTGDTVDCSLFKGDDASPKNDDSSPKTPAPPVFLPAYPVTLVTPRVETFSAPLADRNGPPTAPPRRTHGRGALPLLS